MSALERIYATELQRLEQLVTASKRAQSGTTLLLRGEAGWFFDLSESRLHAISADPVVIRGRFELGGYAPMGQPPTESGASLEKLAAVAGWLSPWLGPIGGFANQLIQTGVGSWKLLEGALGEAADRGPTELLATLVRRAAAEHPVVCMIENADQAPGTWWFDVVDAITRQAAAGVPVVLLLSLRPFTPASSEADDEPHYLLRSLLQQQLAHWFLLPDLDAERIRILTGDAAADVRLALLDATQGNPAWAEQLWSEWRAVGAVSEDASGRYVFDDTSRSSALFPVDDLVRRHIVVRGQGDHQELARVRRILAYASIEGRRFTPEALALALAVDEEELLSTLDRLSQSVGDLKPITAEEPALATEDGPLWRYRFCSTMMWRTLAHHGLTTDERRDASARLARALQDVHWPDLFRVAHTLARLLADVGENEAAEDWARRARVMAQRDVLEWQAAQLLADRDDWNTWPRARCREAAELLLEAFATSADSRRRDELLEPVRAAAVLAETAGEQLLLGQAKFYEGQARLELGQHQLSAEASEAARELFRAMRKPGQEALALAQVGLAVARMGRNRDAELLLKEAIPLHRKAHDVGGEANTTHDLGHLALQRGELETAATRLQSALALRRAAADEIGEAKTLVTLANVERRQGKIDAAAPRLTRALTIFRSAGDRASETAALHALGSLAYDVGDFEAAESYHGEQLRIARALRDHVMEGFALHGLGSVATSSGRYADARQRLEAALRIRRTIDDPLGVATSLRELGALAAEEGRSEEAAQLLGQALHMFERLQHPSGIASAHHSLGTMAYQRGRLAEAKKHLKLAISVANDIGDATLARSAKQCLDTIGND